MHTRKPSPRQADADDMRNMRERGVIREVNRLLLHPMGISIGHSDGRVVFVVDDDPAGTTQPDLDEGAADLFRVVHDARRAARVAAFGWHVQPALGGLEVHRPGPVVHPDATDFSDEELMALKRAAADYSSARAASGANTRAVVAAVI
jgi:hypothetical protein